MKHVTKENILVFFLLFFALAGLSVFESTLFSRSSYNRVLPSEKMEKSRVSFLNAV